MVPLGPPAEADGEQHRRHGEACGRQAECGAVGAEGQQSIRGHRARQRDRHLQQEDADDGADEPQRRKGTLLEANHGSTVPRLRKSWAGAGVGQNFQPRSGVATSTSTPSGSRNLKNRGGSACSAP